MTHAEVKALQRALNAFTKRSGLGVAPLLIDGDYGLVSRKRVREVKFWLGFGTKHRGSVVSREFLWQLAHPRSFRSKNTERRIRARRGLRRRIARRKDVAVNSVKAFLKPGVGSFDGKPVALCAIPLLEFARAHGWRGQLNSGWRDPNFSRQLCRNICGADSCPGRCAGLSSNHVGNSPERFAIDVSDFATFGQLMRRSDCPAPHVFNALGAQDPVHFSPSGR